MAKRLIGFDEFWKQYPRKENRAAARNAWARLNPSFELQQKILQAVAEQSRPGGILEVRLDVGCMYIPYAVSWLSDRRWEDKPTALPSDIHTEELDITDPRLKALFGDAYGSAITSVH